MKRIHMINLTVSARLSCTSSELKTVRTEHQTLYENTIKKNYESCLLHSCASSIISFVYKTILLPILSSCFMSRNIAVLDTQVHVKNLYTTCL